MSEEYPGDNTPNDLDSWYRKHGPAMYRFAMRLTDGNRALSEDLVQDAFVSMMGKDLSMIRKPEGLLISIVRRRHIDHVRADHRSATVSLDEHSDGPSLDGIDDESARRELALQVIAVACDPKHPDALILRWRAELRDTADARRANAFIVEQLGLDRLVDPITGAPRGFASARRYVENRLRMIRERVEQRPELLDAWRELDH